DAGSADDLGRDLGQTLHLVEFGDGGTAMTSSMPTARQRSSAARTTCVVVGGDCMISSTAAARNAARFLTDALASTGIGLSANA
ncbi:hypothetical protein JDV09_25765, partial [Mycobacterium sp. Y57]|uniref:hypothetical protein n=1 Tax=Mycolicibacterium xanthum TaxID=2796469 RepID=UPI001C849006